MVKSLENRLWEIISEAPGPILRLWQRYFLKNLINTANNLQIYRDLWRGIDLAGFSLDDLEKLPVIDKDFFGHQPIIAHLTSRPIINASLSRYFCDALGQPMRYFEDMYLMHRKQALLDAAKNDVYSLSVFGPVAERCSQGDTYHVYEQSVILEILDEDGRDIGDDSEGRIVVTYFDNHYMPFVRYNTGERGNWAGVCACGKKSFMPKAAVRSIFDQVFRFYYGFIEKYQVMDIAADNQINIKIKKGRFWDDSIIDDLKKQLRQLLNDNSLITELFIE